MNEAKLKMNIFFANVDGLEYIPEERSPYNFGWWRNWSIW